MLVYPTGYGKAYLLNTLNSNDHYLEMFNCVTQEMA